MGRQDDPHRRRPTSSHQPLPSLRHDDTGTERLAQGPRRPANGPSEERQERWGICLGHPGRACRSGFVIRRDVTGVHTIMPRSGLKFDGPVLPHTVLARGLAANPDAVALVEADAKLTWREF